MIISSGKKLAKKGNFGMVKGKFKIFRSPSLCKLAHNTRYNKSKEPLELVHTDVCSFECASWDDKK